MNICRAECNYNIVANPITLKSVMLIFKYPSELVQGDVVMEILVRLGRLLSPSFFAILAGLSLTAAAVLFFAGKRGAAALRVKSSKLSQVEPPEYRGTGYLILAFGCSLVGLVLSFVFAAINPGFLGSLSFIILSLLCFVFTLCFLYAGAGTLLRAVTGQKGGIVRWFFPPMRYVDTLIMQFGDWLTAGLFRPPWYPRIATKIGGLANVVKETPTTVISGYQNKKAAEEMKRLQHKLAEYEACLTPEQREKLTEARRIAEQLRNMYP